jgi:3-hexulose-6-phosphate synthase
MKLNLELFRRPLLQLALDFTDLDQAFKIAAATYPHFDLLEIGTPLIIEEGLGALQKLKAKFPDKLFLADLKIMDAGHLEARSGFLRGADVVTVLGAADDSTIRGAIDAARECDGYLMADLIGLPDPAKRARRLQELGVDCVCVHTAYDRSSRGASPLSELEQVRAAITGSVAVAGGLRLENTEQVIAAGGNIMVVGGAITTHANPGAVAKSIFQKIQDHLR